MNSLDLLNPTQAQTPFDSFLSGQFFFGNPSAQFDRMLEELADEERAKFGVVVEGDLRAQFIVLSVWGLETPRPLPPNMQLVGNMWPVEHLGKWESNTGRWLDSSDKPVLYVSLGSVVQVSDTQLAQLSEGLNLAIQQFGIRVLWILRANQNGQEQLVERFKTHEDFRIEAWGEQRKILVHPKVFCFFSHGGQNSVSESLARGKPLIVMPFYADQFFNAALVARSGSGLQLASLDFGSQDIVQAIKNMLANKQQFTKSAERIAYLMKEAGGAKRAADIAEQTIKIGVDHLIPAKDSATLTKILPHIILSCFFILLFKILKILGKFVGSSKPKKVKHA
eukprot:Phypoly_transcript_06200.p1 GENE.Phypoly_transcript_06200~~Phypoly_transcript_06200.p1  ORF type:complete len:337 (-),score=62.76 Phypoly_transcript_06200:48-1058(-)